MFTCRTLLGKEKLNMPFVLIPLYLERFHGCEMFAVCKKFPILAMLLKTYLYSFEINKMHPEVYIILFVAN
jgi:hypothetical protein